MADSFKEAMGDPEFRNAFLNHAMTMLDTVRRAKVVIDMIENTSFQELTPAMWMDIYNHTGDLRESVELGEQSITSIPEFLDDPRAVDIISEKIGPRPPEE